MGIEAQVHDQARLSPQQALRGAIRLARSAKSAKTDGAANGEGRMQTLSAKDGKYGFGRHGGQA